MAESRDDDNHDRLKASLWFSIGKMVDEEALRMNMNATPQFIGALTEMVWSQIGNVARDLESFSHHAGRTTINTDDVLLIARRNEALYGIMRDFIEEEEAIAARQKHGKRGKGRITQGEV